MVKKQHINYAKSGVNYALIDPIKIVAQNAAKETAKNLVSHGFSEITDSRGESAYVWKQGDSYMASVIEGLGTKNLVADATRIITGKTYYDVVGHDTLATIINDLVSVGATPLVVHAYWATGDSSFLADEQRITDLTNGWVSACNLAKVSWGGGETPTLRDIIDPQTIDLAGLAVGVIKNKNHFLTDKKLQDGDRILFIKSNGINANGLSLARAIAKNLPDGYATKLADGTMYGEAILTKTNIYAKLIQKLLETDVDLHYISNITGHGLRKVMRARHDFTYVIEQVFQPQPLFTFIQKNAGLSEKEMYQTYNMGQDYALFLPEKDVKKARDIIKDTGFESLMAGIVKKGERQVVINPKNIIYKGPSLNLR